MLVGENIQRVGWNIFGGKIGVCTRISGLLPVNPVDPKLNQINCCNLALSTVGVGLVLYPEPFRKDNVFKT